MHSINRLFFLSLGSVCFLIVPFFWLALAFDFSALENFVIALSHAEFVGYPIPELLGSAKGDTVVDKVLRIEIFFTIIAIAYSLFFVGLSYLESARGRVNYCARGVAIPLFLFILGFWLKFIGDDHIISADEKTELFQYTSGGFIISVLMFSYSFRSEKKVRAKKEIADEKNDDDSIKKPVAGQSEASPPPESPDAGVLPPPGDDSASASSVEPTPDLEEDTAEGGTLPPPESPDTGVLPPPGHDSAPAGSVEPIPDLEEGTAEGETLPPPESPDMGVLPPPGDDSGQVSSSEDADNPNSPPS